MGSASLLLSGCFGTLLTSGAPAAAQGSRLGFTLLWGIKPTLIDTECPKGIAQAATAIPLWGLPVAWFTLGTIVPTQTRYTCAR